VNGPAGRPHRVVVWLGEFTQMQRYICRFEARKNSSKNNLHWVCSAIFWLRSG